MSRPVDAPLQRPVRLGVLISGGGTTLQNFLAKIDAGELDAEVAVVIASSTDSGGLAKAEQAGVKSVVTPRGSFADVESFSGAIFEALRAENVDLAAMAGFLCLLRIPDDFRNRVLNIHPSLIPAFCGKGCFGHKVHEAVLDRGVKVSGCTVHFADNEYDHGPIILQRPVPVHDADTPDSLAARVFEAECEAYPAAIRLFAAGRLDVNGRRVQVRG